MTDREDVDGKDDDLKSISVRKGCKLTAINKRLVGSDKRAIIDATGGADKHVNLDSTPELKEVDEDVEAVICECPGETKPKFTQNASTLNLG